MFLEQFLVHARLVIKAFKIGLAGEFNEVVIANLIGSQKNQMKILVMRKVPCPLGAIARSHIGFTSDNRLHIMSLGFLIKINGAKEVAMVGHGDGGHAEILHLLEQGCELVSPVEEAILSVKMEMNELCWHSCDPSIKNSNEHLE